MADDSDKINYLFKKSLYKPHTHKTFKYYEENTANFNTNVLNKDIFVQEIPENPSWNLSTTVSIPPKIQLRDNSRNIIKTNWGNYGDDEYEIPESVSDLFNMAVHNPDNISMTGVLREGNINLDKQFLINDIGFMNDNIRVWQCRKNDANRLDAPVDGGFGINLSLNNNKSYLFVTYFKIINRGAGPASLNFFYSQSPIEVLHLTDDGDSWENAGAYYSPIKAGLDESGQLELNTWYVCFTYLFKHDTGVLAQPNTRGIYKINNNNGTIVLDPTFNSWHHLNAERVSPELGGRRSGKVFRFTNINTTIRWRITLYYDSTGNADVRFYNPCVFEFSDIGLTEENVINISYQELFNRVYLTYNEHSNITNIVNKYTNLPLSLIPNSNNDGTLGAFYSLDVCGNNLLEDTIPYRFSKLADDTFPYRYILKYDGTKIENSEGNWVFDEKNGIIKFYGSTINIDGTVYYSADTNLTLSFKKYIGQKGFIKSVSTGGSIVNKYVIPYDISVNEIRCNRIIKDTVNNIHVTGNLYVNGVIKYKDDDINQKIYDIFDLENIIFNSTW